MVKFVFVACWPGNAKRLHDKPPNNICLQPERDVSINNTTANVEKQTNKQKNTLNSYFTYATSYLFYFARFLITKFLKNVSIFHSTS